MNCINFKNPAFGSVRFTYTRELEGRHEVENKTRELKRLNNDIQISNSNTSSGYFPQEFGGKYIDLLCQITAPRSWRHDLARADDFDNAIKDVFKNIQGVRDVKIIDDNNPGGYPYMAESRFNNLHGMERVKAILDIKD